MNIYTTIENFESLSNSAMADMTANCKSPKGLAEELKRQFVERFGISEAYAYVWSPEEAAMRGWGDSWCLCMEEGPYNWPSQLINSNMAVLDHPTVFAEPYNHFVLSFYKNWENT